MGNERDGGAGRTSLPGLLNSGGNGHAAGGAAPGRDGPAVRPPQAQDAGQNQAHPAPVAGRDDRGHPAEPRIGADGSWEWRGARLTPDQCRTADRVYAQFRTAEGRNGFGGYGRSGLTPAMRRVEAQLEHGRLAAETERYALRDGNLFRHQLAGLLSRHPGRDPEDLAYRITDVIWYAYVFDAEGYAEGTWEVHRRLKAHGFDLEERVNGWAGGGRDGIRTRWRDPAYKLPFEVQFHTQESWDALRGGGSAGGQPPPGWSQIADYRKDAG